MNTQENYDLQQVNTHISLVEYPIYLDDNDIDSLVNDYDFVYDTYFEGDDKNGKV